MITTWTIRRISPMTNNGTPSWAVLEDGLDGQPYVVCGAGNLTMLLADFSDLVALEFDGIKKEVTEA